MPVISFDYPPNVIRLDKKEIFPVKLIKGLVIFSIFVILSALSTPVQAKPYPWEVQQKKTPSPPPAPTPSVPQKPTGQAPSIPASPAKTIYLRAVKAYLGEGVERDYPTAFRLFKEAADQGYPPAQHMTGVCYEYGRGTGKDLEEAFRYFRLGAKGGNAKAQFKVGAFYWFGKGRTKNYTQAVAWYKRSAEQGFGPALNNLGVAYENALGVKRNLEMARAYYEKAARKGNVKGYENLVRLSDGMGKPIPLLKNRIRMGVFDIQASKHWTPLPIKSAKGKKQWFFGYVTKKGATPNLFILFRSDSFGFTSMDQRKKIEKELIKEMKVTSPGDVQSMKVARHKTLVLRAFDGEDTAFTLLPYDDISLHLIVVLYQGQDVPRLTQPVRAYLSTLVLRHD